jgi:hypothetical protein
MVKDQKRLHNMMRSTIEKMRKSFYVKCVTSLPNPAELRSLWKMLLWCLQKLTLI